MDVPSIKHPYFGDINDYRKYGLLRLRARDTIRLGVCWMLTRDDTGSDGKFTRYLYAPHLWRGYDPPRFDALHQTANIARVRNVNKGEQRALLPAADFYTPYFLMVKRNAKRISNACSNSFRMLISFSLTRITE